MQASAVSRCVVSSWHILTFFERGAEEVLVRGRSKSQALQNNTIHEDLSAWALRISWRYRSQTSMFLMLCSLKAEGAEAGRCYFKMLWVAFKCLCNLLVCMGLRRFLNPTKRLNPTASYRCHYELRSRAGRATLYVSSLLNCVFTWLHNCI